MRACLVVSLFLASALYYPIAAATLAGQVVEDSAGRPLPSADVRVYRVGVRGLAAELETDSEGRFRADGLPDGEYRLEVSKANHLGATLNTKIQANAGLLAVRLVRCGVISGQVVDGKGQPVTGVQVYALRTDRKPLRPETAPGRFAWVDGRGRYRLFNLPPGPYVVAASYGASTLAMGSSGSSATPASFGSGVLYHPSNTAPQPLVIHGGEEFRNIDFSVYPGSLYSVSGRVNAGAPKERHNFWVTLSPVDQPALAVAVAIAKADGSFQLSGIAAGSYRIFASGPTNARGAYGAQLEEDALFARANLNVGAQDIEGVSLSPEKGRTAAFTFAGPTSGCTGSAELVLTSLEDWGANLRRSTPLIAGKEMVLSGLAPARYQLSVTGLGDTCHVAESVLDLSRPASAGPVKIAAVPAGSIEGRVAAGHRVSGLMIALADLAGDGQAVQIAAPDDEGKFTFASLKPGRYRLTARNAKALWSTADVEVTGGAAVAVELAPAAKGE